MVKFLLGIAIVAFTSFCGYLLSKKYRRKKLFFMQFKEFNERFLNEISYYKRPLKAFLFEYPYKDEFKTLIEAFLSVKEMGALIELLRSEEFSFLKAEEKEGIADYFSMLGKGDSQSQKAYFSSAKERIAKLYSEAESLCKKYGDLYIKIGFLCGLLILILII